MLSKLLYLDHHLLRRCWPFLGLYLLLFAALTLADGLSLTLFVQRAGAARLPLYYGLSAVGMAVAAGLYMSYAGRFSGGRVFHVILAGPSLLFLLIWLAVGTGQGDVRLLGLLFLGREIAMSLVLLHFGTWLLDYFTRGELNRVMPVIYAGGRIGGIVGGAMLQHLSQVVAPIHLMLLLVALLVLAMGGVALIQRRVPLVEEEETIPNSAAGTRPLEPDAPRNLAGFPRFLWASPLLFWITVSTVALFACRTMLSVQYNGFLETAFPSEAETARFLGLYTQIALAGSLVVQLFVINRIIALVGLKGAHLLYASLLASAAMLTLLPMTLATAVAARLVENELRFCLRNPVSQMIVNQFSKATRLLARAWSLGLLIPLSTLAASVAMALLLQGGLAWILPPLTALLGLGYLLASFPLVHSFDEPPPRTAVRTSGPLSLEAKS